MYSDKIWENLFTSETSQACALGISISLEGKSKVWEEPVNQQMWGKLW